MFEVAAGVGCREDVAQRRAYKRSVERRKGSGVLQATGTTLLRNATARQAVAGVSEEGSRPCR